MELSGNESIKQAVMGNMGLAFLSLHTAGLELQSNMLVVLDVVGLPLIRHWHVVSLGSEPMSDAAASVRRFIVEEGGDFIERQFNGKFWTERPRAQPLPPRQLTNQPIAAGS
jgi:DNA-binding transcriptional LysR family regulator